MKTPRLAFRARPMVTQPKAVTPFPNSLLLTVGVCVLLFVTVFSINARANPLGDPIGDTFGIAPIQIDISSVSAVYTSTNLSLVVSFTDPIAPASSFAANSVIGFVDFDIDQDASTGTASRVALFGPPPEPVLGVEFFLDLLSEAFHPGEVEIQSELFGATQFAPISFGATSFSTIIPLAFLGGDDGLLNYALIVGTFEEATDKAPNGNGFGTSAPLNVPEPITLVLLLCGIASLGIFKTAFHKHSGSVSDDTPDCTRRSITDRKWCARIHVAYGREYGNKDEIRSKNEVSDV